MSRTNFGYPVHHQMPDLRLACGAEHLADRPPEVQCCRRDPGQVTCEACKSAAGQPVPADSALTWETGSIRNRTWLELPA